MYGCDSWTIKKAEHQRIDALELWYWRRLLRVPWTTRRSNQSILKEISPEYSLERLMLKLKLQYFGHLIQRTDLLGSTLIWGKLKAGGEGDDRGWDGWMTSLTQLAWVWASSWELVMDRAAYCAAVHGVSVQLYCSQTQLSHWTELHWSVTSHRDFGAQENKIWHCFHFSPSFCLEVMWPDAMILVFECWGTWNLFIVVHGLSSFGTGAQ